MLKYREYNSRPYSLQCFIEWVQNIENAISEEKTIERMHLNWKLIELDLNRCAKNETLRHKIWRPMPPNYGLYYQNAEANKIYDQYKEKNKISFAGSSSIVDYILNGQHSPMYKVVEVYSNYYAADAVHILKLLVKCNIVLLDEISYQHVTIAEHLQKEVIYLLKHQSHPEFIEQCIDCLVLIDDKNTEFNMKFNAFAQILYDEENEQWHCKLFAKMKHWMPLKSNIWERLLFRGMKPFQCETFTDTKWMELFTQQYTICRKSQNPETFEAFVSPFLIYPYFIRAKDRMKTLLMDCIDIFHEDCIYVIMCYVFPDDMMYTNCYNEYSEQSAIKAVEFLSCLRLISDTPSTKKDILDKYCDDIGCIKYCFDHFQEKTMERMDAMYLYKLLTKYTFFQNMSIDFHYNFLKKVIGVGSDGYYSRFYYTCNGKKREIPKLQLFQTYISRLNEEIVGKVFNYSKENTLYNIYHTTLLIEATRRFVDICNNDHLQIIRFMVNHKSVDINNDFLLKEMNTNSKVFATAVENKQLNVISALLKSRKISNHLICKTILYHLRTRTYRRDKYRDIYVVKSIHRFLKRRAKKITNPTQRKMVIRTASMIGKWITRSDYFKYCLFTFDNECA